MQRKINLDGVTFHYMNLKRIDPKMVKLKWIFWILFNIILFFYTTQCFKRIYMDPCTKWQTFSFMHS